MLRIFQWNLNLGLCSNVTIAVSLVVSQVHGLLNDAETLYLELSIFLK